MQKRQTRKIAKTDIPANFIGEASGLVGVIAVGQRGDKMDDLISKQTVIDIVDSYSESQSNVEDVTQDIISDIMALSSVKQESKTGHWIYKQYDGYPECGDYHCSECDKIDNHIPAYCSYCGAKMNNEVKE